jgi:phosphoribosylformylglycinamidine synthase
MKNDANLDGVKISIPPTLLVSAMGQIPDVTRAMTLEPRAVGDDVWLLGRTREELGGSAWLRRRAGSGGVVPHTDLGEHVARYRAFVAARDAGLIRSAHAVARGGLAVAASHLVLASWWSLQLTLPTDDVSDGAWTFGESTGRILFTARTEDADALRRHLHDVGLVRLGSVVVPGDEGPVLQIDRGTSTRWVAGAAAMRDAFTGGLAGL